MMKLHQPKPLSHFSPSSERTMSKKMRICSVLLLVLLSHVESFSVVRSTTWRQHASTSLFPATPTEQLPQQDQDVSLSRRSLLTTVGQQSVLVSMLLTMGVVASSSCQAAAAAAAAESSSDAQITDRIYLDIKGLAAPTLDDSPQPQRIVIGLYGKDAPEAVEMLKALVTKEGLAADCKPKEIRTLQKEQLEANKVYNACMEGQAVGQGVNYDLSTIWRVIQNERIDVGAVSGRFVARQFPTWKGDNNLKHDAPGVVSVRKGNDSGFGFTIHPGDNASSYLDANHLVVGRVVEGLNVVEAINQVPVVTSKFASRQTDLLLPAAPSRACRYGGNQLYCNEYKPLTKLSIASTGVL